MCASRSLMHGELHAQHCIHSAHACYWHPLLSYALHSLTSTTSAVPSVHTAHCCVKDTCMTFPQCWWHLQTPF
jgi:hypothetical protein